MKVIPGFVSPVKRELCCETNAGFLIDPSLLLRLSLCNYWGQDLVKRVNKGDAMNDRQRDVQRESSECIGN